MNKRRGPDSVIDQLVSYASRKRGRRELTASVARFLGGMLHHVNNVLLVCKSVAQFFWMCSCRPLQPSYCAVYEAETVLASPSLSDFLGRPIPPRHSGCPGVFPPPAGLAWGCSRGAAIKARVRRSRERRTEAALLKSPQANRRNFIPVMLFRRSFIARTTETGRRLARIVTRVVRLANILFRYSLSGIANQTLAAAGKC